MTTPTNRDQLIRLICTALDGHVGFDHEGAAAKVLDAIKGAGLAVVPAYASIQNIEAGAVAAIAGECKKLTGGEKWRAAQTWTAMISRSRVDGGP